MGLLGRPLATLLALRRGRGVESISIGSTPGSLASSAPVRGEETLRRLGPLRRRTAPGAGARPTPGQRLQNYQNRATTRESLREPARRTGSADPIARPRQCQPGVRGRRRRLYGVRKVRGRTPRRGIVLGQPSRSSMAFWAPSPASLERRTSSYRESALRTLPPIGELFHTMPKSQHRDHGAGRLTDRSLGPYQRWASRYFRTYRIGSSAHAGHLLALKPDIPPRSGFATSTIRLLKLGKYRNEHVPVASGRCAPAAQNLAP